jgi:hypothetical protein
MGPLYENSGYSAGSVHGGSPRSSRYSTQALQPSVSFSVALRPSPPVEGGRLKARLPHLPGARRERVHTVPVERMGERSIRTLKVLSGEE